MKALFTSMLQALAQGEGVVLCSILASSGSTPRGAGAKSFAFRRAICYDSSRRRRVLRAPPRILPEKGAAPHDV